MEKLSCKMMFASSVLWSWSVVSVGGAAWWAWVGYEEIGGLTGVCVPEGDPYAVHIRSKQ